VKKSAENDYRGGIALTFPYAGLRSTELTELNKTDYNRENQTIKGGIKTDAGRGRIVPVHPILQEFFSELADKNEPYLFGKNSAKTGKCRSAKRRIQAGKR
jgi:integrase